MTRLLEDTPSAPSEALAAEPLSVAEIDAHPDSARIWATILAMREEHETSVEEAYQDGISDAHGGSNG